MCFSASASFTAGALLTTGGIATLMYVKTKQQRMMACIPLLFGIQQSAEGLVWTGLTNENPTLTTMGTYVFLFFAYFFWPMWVPLTLRQFDPARRHAISLTLIAGFAIGCALLVNVITHGASASIVGHHIAYTITMAEQFIIPGTVAYLIATVLPFFIARVPLLRVMGIMIAFAYVISYAFYRPTLGSIWCFFAALLSVMSIIIALRYQRPLGRQ